jgi:amidase
MADGGCAMFLKRPLAGRPARIPLCQSSCLPSLERELVVQERRYPYWDHVVWCGALANFAYLPPTARPITCTSAGLPMGIQIVGPYLEDRTPIQAAC